MNDSLRRGNFRMKLMFKRFVAFVFVCVVLVQVYFGMAQIVEALQPARARVHTRSRWRGRL